MGLQKEHHLANFLLVSPSLADHIYPLFPNALYFSELLDLLFDDLQGLFPEGVDNPLGHDGADAFDEAGPEVFLDAVY